MKYCSKCGTPAQDNQNFCLNCGSKLTAPAAAADTAQGQLAAQQQQVAATAQTMQDQLAAQQANAAQAAATVQAQQQAAVEAAAQVAATAEAQQAAAEAAAKAKSAAEAAAKAEAVRQAANTAGGAEAVIAQSQATAQAAVAQAQAVAQQAAQPVVPMAQAGPVAAPVVQQAAPAAGGEKKSGAGKWFAIIGFALVAVILVVILLVNVLGSSYQTPIKKMISAMNSKSTDSDDYMAVYPKVFTNLYKDSLKTAKEGFKLIGKENLATMLDQMGFGASMNEVFDDYEKVVGKNIKFSYSIQEKKKLEPAVLASIAGKYKALAMNLESQAEKVESKTKSVITEAGAKNKDAIDYCDSVKAVIEKAAADIEAINASSITDGYDVKIYLTVKGDKDEDRDEATYRILKINGKWVFDATYASSMFDTDLINSLINMMMLRSY